MKLCNHCNKLKSTDQFCKYKRTKDGLNSWCKECATISSRSWYNKTKQTLTTDEWAARNKKHALKAMYGLSFAEYQVLLTKQDYKCRICRIPEIELDRKLSVDHSHKNGQVRALLCNSCNNGLGRFKDSADLLREAASYLEEINSVVK